METTTPKIYAYSAPLLDGRTVSLSAFSGQVLLIVNTASKCGFTPQYASLEQLYRLYKDRGFAVLGFPCNQFGQQEPGTAQEIRTFCQQSYGVTFPVFDKIEVNGPGAHSLYRFLTRIRPGFLGTKSIKWNFTKFLVSRDGRVVARYAPARNPKALAHAIEKLLNAQ